MGQVSNDEDFLQIPNLKWLPWIGSDYSTSTSKILIVGESHYYNNTLEEIEEFKRKEKTREVVDWMGVKNNHGKIKFFPNLYRLLVDNSFKELGLFWSRVSFYNFIQEPIVKGKRPQWMDFDKSLPPFFNLLEKLTPSPTICLMCGIESNGHIKRYIENSNFKIVSLNEQSDKIGGVTPRIIKIESPKGAIINLIFIRHPSWFMYKWKVFLSNNFPEFVSRFDDLRVSSNF